jgi:hypothetical protein
VKYQTFGVLSGVSEVTPSETPKVLFDERNHHARNSKRQFVDSNGCLDGRHFSARGSGRSGDTNQSAQEWGF